MRQLSRRRFLRYTVMGSVGLIVVEALAGVAFYLRPNIWRPDFGFKITVGHNEIPAVGDPPMTHPAGQFHLVNTEAGVLAMWTLCTHGHCATVWDERDQNFTCPCHGAWFDRVGNLLGGPAPRPLDLMSAAIDSNGNVVIDTGDISQRERYEPSQATPL